MRLTGPPWPPRLCALLASAAIAALPPPLILALHDLTRPVAGPGDVRWIGGLLLFGPPVAYVVAVIVGIPAALAIERVTGRHASARLSAYAVAGMVVGVVALVVFELWPVPAVVAGGLGALAGGLVLPQWERLEPHTVCVIAAAAPAAWLGAYLLIVAFL